MGTFTKILTHGRPNRGEGTPPLWKSWVRLADRDAFPAERVRLYQHRPAEELYDLRTNPFEMNNIAGDASQKEVLASLCKELRKWMRQQGDPLLSKLADARG